jgi:hypothetical protein
MVANQTSDPRILPPIFQGRTDWWGFLRGLILIFSSALGLALLYSIWTFLRS